MLLNLALHVSSSAGMCNIKTRLMTLMGSKSCVINYSGLQGLSIGLDLHISEKKHVASIWPDRLTAHSCCVSPKVCVRLAPPRHGYQERLGICLEEGIEGAARRHGHFSKADLHPPLSFAGTGLLSH
jgi:hypothetical protein